MTELVPLPADEVYKACDAAALPFMTTAELTPLDQPVGQARAMAALEFGAAMRRQGYNLFVLGQSGSGRFSIISEHLRQRAAGEPRPQAWCYVHNFTDPGKPTAMDLPPGRATGLRKAMEKLVQELKAALPAAFDTEEYRGRRQVIDEELKRRHDTAFEQLGQKAMERGVVLIRTPLGMGLAPVKGNEVMPPEEFARLPQEEQTRLREAMREMQEELEATVARIPQWQREHREAVRKLNEEVSSFAVRHLIGEVRADFQDIPKALAYLDEVERDIVMNTDEFLADGQGPTGDGTPTPDFARDADNHRYRRYRVNVVMDHEGAGAPVVFEDHPTHQALVGRIEHVARFGALMTDFNLIKPGALHRANGGYLLLDARRLLQNPYAWESLKRAIRARQIRIESLEQLLALAATVSLEPGPIPLDLKVVLIGDRWIYYLLCQHDPEFSELFKVAADFEDDVERTDQTTIQFARLLATLAGRHGLRHLDRAAAALAIEQAARSAGDGGRLSTRVRPITELLEEADHLAAARGSERIEAADIRGALEARRGRLDRLYRRAVDQITEGTLLIDIAGNRIGQVNGLSVTSLGEIAFGRPVRITASVRFGRGNVVDIEREVELGGPLHSKGVLILSGFLAGRYLPEKPLSLSASLVFEQSYGGVEGDSASSAELYALLSALAGLPVRQDLAVTGSVNQHGEIQAIGGVNEKIEGFYDVCRARKLTGSQGVLIPAANARHLMLREDVVEAVRAGKFAVYPVRTIDDGIALLCSTPAGERGADGVYPAGTVNGLVEKRIAAFAEAAGRLTALAKGDRHG
ncbi:Lon protease family protein [Desertibaculum subflavum]|uniref:Lon protease family protein n=1 Tax=Desertibaculum subflavum TaxID=2268458 RepID=UPI000E66E0CB